MAKENFTAVPNFIFDNFIEFAAAAKLTSTIIKIFFKIIRDTYGFNRKEHKMTTSYLAATLKISERYIIISLNKMQEMNLITITHSDSGYKIIGIQEDAERWKLPGNPEPQFTLNHSSPRTTVQGNPDVQFRVDPEPQFTQENKEYKERYKETGAQCAQSSHSDTGTQNFLLFEKLWNKYPKEKRHNKCRIKKEQRQFICENYDMIKKALEKYLEYIELEKVPEEYIKFAPTFFNGGYMEFAEDEKQEKESKYRKV